MAFVVILFRGEEVDRRELNGPITIGRAPECDISVRDILLSRRHCRIVPAEPTGWAIEDLGSKNGTLIGGEPVQWSLLKDDTSVRIGKTQLKFYTASMRPAAAAAAPKRPSAPQRRRPSDPFEALSGTVSAFEYVPEGPERDVSKLPNPAPKPADPAAYANEDVYTMLTEIASSSWDSIYATASGPAAVMVAGQKPQRALPTPGAKVVADLPPRRRNVITDPSLQVSHEESSAPTKIMHAVDAHPTTPSATSSGRRWFRPFGSALRGVKNVLTGRFLRRAS
jgi:hypothetical protein